MDQNAKLNLDKLIKEYGSEETTDKIRELKHSKLIRKDLKVMIETKQNYGRLEKNLLQNMLRNKCSFLHQNYTHIFNKLSKDRIDLNMFTKFLDVLEKIENGECDQHEGSYIVGELLKKIFIDSALRENEQNEKRRGKNKKKYKKSKNISWAEYKKMNN